jgi:hypothetical protein
VDHYALKCEPFLAKSMPYRWATLLVCLFVAASAHADVVSDMDKTMLLNKPYFTLRLNMRDCRYTVEMNGALVNEDNQGQSSTVNLPVNQWMRTGANELTLSILTFEGEYPISTETRCEVSLQVRPDDGTEAQTVTISHLVFSGKLASVASKGTEESSAAGKYDSKHQFLAARSGDVTISETTIGPLPEDSKSKLAKQTITLTTPFPEWAFFKSDVLPDADTMTDAEFDRYQGTLFVYYKRIQDAWKSKNVDSILPMFEERNRETDQAFYFPPGTTAKKIAQALKSAANDPDLELVGMTEKSLMTHTHDNKKLIDLVRNDGDAIVFNLRGGGSESYPIIFRKQGDKWIITR